MIRVERDPALAPELLGSDAASEAIGRAAVNFGNDEVRATQEPFAFERLYRDRAVLGALGSQFAEKCAFCESEAGAGAVGIAHHFRPKQEAVDEHGSVSRPHYWWLVYDWDNLYLSCQWCATAAGPYFPVVGQRAPSGTRGPELRKCERPLLVDPCHDYPSEHLLFQDDGTVVGRTVIGKETITCYSLNRTPLVHARLDAINVAIEVASAGHRTARRNALAMALSPRRPYSAAVRQAVSRVAEGGPAWMRELLVENYRQKRDAAPPLSVARRPSRRLVEPVHVQSVEIRDFRGIEHLYLELIAEDHRGGREQAPTAPDDERWPSVSPAFAGPWTMLLGENGFGKTSVLHALALALMGESARARQRFDPEKLVRHGAQHCEVTVRLRGLPEPRQVRLERTGALVVHGDDSPVTLAGYGAGRIPPHGSAGRLPRRYRVRPRVESLFDPHARMMPAKGWLLSLDNDTFEYAARALRRLMLQPQATFLRRADDEVWLEGPQGSVPLDQLSDGYRSVISLAADMMSVFLKWFDSMDAAEGVVLIDEIGAHLHPSWQMRVVNAFRSAFPRLQIVATTHDPLCLRGLEETDVVAVLRRTSDRHVYSLPVDEVPPVAGLRVDELLTSEVFGLNSTVDDDLDQAFHHYYGLLADDDRSASATAELERLRHYLQRFQQFGTSRRERIALEAADAFVARERDVVDPEARRHLADRTRQELLRIWQEPEFGGESQ